MLLAEAGTGIGKTLGLSRAGILVGGAGRRRGLGVDLHKGVAAATGRRGRRLFPDAEERKRKIVIRKGRENYSACSI